MKNELKYHGNVMSIYGIAIVNFFLKVITLFIYAPWAKTRMRRYLYNNISIFGSRLEYLGTGGEIFRAYIKLSLILLLLSASVSILILSLGLGILQQNILQIVQLVWDYVWIIGIVLFMSYYASYAGLGYRLSRTTWNGIRGKLHGKAKAYMFFRVKRLLLNIVSLGFLTGRSDILARRYKMENLAIGKTRFKFLADEKALDKVNLVTLILAIPTLFISRIYYKTEMLKLFWNSTQIENVKFKSNHSFAEVLWLTFSNLILVLFTLGLAIPIVINRSARYFAKFIEISGSIEGSQILQDINETNAAGEALEEISSDVGLDIDIGLW